MTVSFWYFYMILALMGDDCVYFGLWFLINAYCMIQPGFVGMGHLIFESSKKTCDRACRYFFDLSLMQHVCLKEIQNTTYVNIIGHKFLECRHWFGYVFHLALGRNWCQHMYVYCGIMKQRSVSLLQAKSLSFAGLSTLKLVNNIFFHVWRLVLCVTEEAFYFYFSTCLYVANSVSQYFTLPPPIQCGMLL